LNVAATASGRPLSADLGSAIVTVLMSPPRGNQRPGNRQGIPETGDEIRSACNGFGVADILARCNTRNGYMG